jgi:Ca2+-binding RTX toxin-like protein
VTGSLYGDVLVGAGDDNVLSGDFGDDGLIGQGGDDTLIGGLGADELIGVSGSDTASYIGAMSGIAASLASGEGSLGEAAGDTFESVESLTGSLFTDTLTGDASANVLDGYGGNDELKGGGGADTLVGGTGTDTATYIDSNSGVTVALLTGLGSGGTAEGDTLSEIENVTGSALADTLTGDDDANTLDGGGSADELKGGGGADTLIGGIGTDTATYIESGSAVTVNLISGLGFGGTAEGDTLISIANLVGSVFADTLWGDADANVLSGAGGDDWLKGGGGADTLNGGSGIDTAAYIGSSAGVVVSLMNDLSGSSDGDELDSIENVTGSAYADTLWGSDDANVLSGMNGNDGLKGFGGTDTLRGGADSDYLDGGAGADTMVGGTGDDTYIVDNASDVVTENGGQGVDVVLTSVSYTLTAGADVETLATTDDTAGEAINLTGNASGNEIRGNNGDNVLTGGGGTDQLVGRGGNDTYVVDSATDSIVEGAGLGADTVRTSASFALTAGTDVETLETTDDSGMAAIDLTGNSSGNIVRGNNGNNVIGGGEGDDELTGLAGQDSFRFDTSLDAAFNLDVITDFNVADDTILLDQTIFSSSLGLGNISAGEFVIGAAALDANDRIIYDNSNGALSYDNDGVGGNAAIQFAQLSPGLAPTNLDFLVVA